MKLEGISEDDLNGIMFVHFPDGMPFDECLDSLEMTIANLYDAEYGDLAEDEKPEMTINPYWIVRALSVRNGREWDRTSEANKAATLNWCWKRRERDKAEARA